MKNKFKDKLQRKKKQTKPSFLVRKKEKQNKIVFAEVYKDTQNKTCKENSR